MLFKMPIFCFCLFRVSVIGIMIFKMLILDADCLFCRFMLKNNKILTNDSELLFLNLIKFESSMMLLLFIPRQIKQLQYSLCKIYCQNIKNFVSIWYFNGGTNVLPFKYRLENGQQTLKLHENSPYKSLFM